MADRKAYPSDLTDAEWEILEPLIPAISEEAAHVKYTRREIVNGILYVLRSGCPWRLLPNDLPAWGTVHDYFRQWQKQGIWDQALEALRKQMRQKQGRDEEPSAAVIDSQSIKTSAVRGSDKGYDAGKKIWGRKRHLLVDTQGNLMEVKVTGADDSDLAGGIKLVEPLQERFPRLSLIWGDSHYGGQFLEWVKEHLGWDVQTVRRLGTPHDANTIEPKPKAKASKGSFTVLPRRWVVERAFGWIVRWRRLARDHEGLPQSSEAFIKISAFRFSLCHAKLTVSKEIPMTTDNTSNPLNPLPLLSQEMERTLRRLAWKDEIFQDALIADPKGIIQYLFHQSLPNGKLPDDLTIKVIEEDPYTHHIVLPPLPDEEPTLEIPEEEQLDLVINLGDGGKRPRESKESEQSNGAKGEREPSWHEREVKRKKADEQDAKVPTKTEVAKALSKAMHEDQKIRQAVKKALDTDGNLNSAIQMMQDKGYLSGFKLPKDVNYKRLQNTEGTYHLVLQSSRNASGVPELDHEAIAKQPNKNMANSDIATRCGDYCNPDNTRNACGN